MKLKADIIHLKDSTYVKPEGMLGTCGWTPYPWELIAVPRNTTQAQADYIITSEYMHYIKRTHHDPRSL